LPQSRSIAELSLKSEGQRQNRIDECRIIIMAKNASPFGPGASANSLRVPAGEFRCVDIPYDELVAAGLPPDPRTGAVMFQILPFIEQGNLFSPGGTGIVSTNQTRTVGAVVSVDVATGKIEQWQPFGVFSDEKFHIN
jgi:hypothetical protein